jgi:phosphatidylglycerol lysyltransferase
MDDANRMSQSADTVQPAARSWFARARVAIPLLFLALVGWLVVREIDELDLPQIQRTLLEVPTLSALGVAVLALIAVAFTGLVDVAIARWLGIGLRFRDMLRLGFIANAMANTLNLSGATGSGVRLLGLSAQRVELSRGAALIGMQVLSLPLGLSILIIVTLAMGSLPITPNTTTRWLAIVVLVAAALYLPAFFVLTTRRTVMRWLPKGQDLPPLKLKLLLAALSFVDWLLAAAVLYACLFLSGAHVKPGPLLGSFAGASILGLASLVPGGFGVFDGLMLVALSAGGYDQGAVTAGLFLFRIAYYLLPLLTALYLGSGTVARQMPILAHTLGRLRAHPLFAVLGLPASLLADLGIRLLAALTFLAGLVLLASAAIPAMHERVVMVRQVLPAAAIESSYWLSILTGTLLLGLGRGIDGRLRVAYRLALWVLIVGAILAVTKGLHFGEALFLLVIAALLRLRKREFTQRAMSLTSATTFTWYVGLIVVVLAFFAAGVWAVLGDDSFDLWYFGVGEHSSRIGRGLFAALLGVVIYLIWQSFAVRRPPLKLPERAELERARAL